MNGTAKKGAHRNKRYSGKWYRTTFSHTAAIMIIIIGEQAREYKLNHSSKMSVLRLLRFIIIFNIKSSTFAG